MKKANQIAAPQKNAQFRFHPSQLSDAERTRHVVDSLLSYNEGIIQNNTSGARLKFKKLQDSPFSSMRGTADLMYRNFQGTDADKCMVLCAENIHLLKANPFYGYTEVQDISYLVRKRSPFRRTVGLKELSTEKAFTSYVVSCGKTLALTHLQSDEVLEDVYPDIAASILHSIHPETFSDDISGFAVKMAGQVALNWEVYRNDYQEKLSF